MKKRIIITALSIMLASSTVMPAYAALPAGMPAVEYSESVTMQDIYNGLYMWADQYVEELKTIEDIKARYQRMIELVATNFGAPPDGSHFNLQLAVSQYNDGVVGDSWIAHIVEYWGEKTDTPCGKYWAVNNGIDTYMPYLLVDGERRYSITNTIRLYGMKDEYLLAPAGTCGIVERNLDGEIHSEEFTGPQFIRTGSYKLCKTIIVYCEDGTCRDLERANLGNKDFDLADYCGDSSSYYRAVDGKFIPITREEIVGLGYQGIW